MNGKVSIICDEWKLFFDSLFMYSVYTIFFYHTRAYNKEDSTPGILIKTCPNFLIDEVRIRIFQTPVKLLLS